MSEYTNGYYVIAEANYYESYEWSIVAAVYHPDLEAYFLYVDGGCSCNYPYEPADWGSTPWTPDSRPMQRKELISELVKMRKYMSGDQWVSDVNNVISEVNEFRPEELTPDED